MTRIELAAIVAFAAMAGAYIIIFHFPVPYYDHWEVAPLLEAADAGALRASDLLAIHGGHWIASPYLLFIALAFATHWSQLAEALAMLALMIGACGALARMGATFAVANNARFGPFALAAAFCCFSLDQATNLIWTFQITVFLCLAAAMLCIAALTARGFSVAHFIAAQLSLAISITSFAAGFAVMPVGLALIAVRNDASPLRRALYAIVWIAACVAWCMAFMYWQQHSRFGRFDVLEDIRHADYAAVLAGFEINYIGAAIARLTQSLVLPAAMLGPLAVLGFAGFLARRKISRNAIAIPLALCAFSIGAGLLCGIGRYDFGADQGSNGRYVTFASLFWLGAAWLALGVLAQIQAKTWRHVLIGAIALCAVLKFASGVQAAQKTTRISRDVAAVAEHMRADPAHAATAAQAIADHWQYPDLERHIAFLRAKRWSVFANSPAPRSLPTPPPDAQPPPDAATPSSAHPP